MSETGKSHASEADSFIIKRDATEDGVQVSVSVSSFARLGIVWMAAVICGGITPGMALFAHLFAEAGIFADACSHAKHPLCHEQYLYITNLLGILMALVGLAMWPGGMLFDSFGARASGTMGAVVLAVGILMLIVSLTLNCLPLFSIAVLTVDMGSMINNLAFYGLLWHLPGQQTLLLAASNGCMQVSAVLPIVVRKVMNALGWSLVSALTGYAVIVCIAGCLCWLSVPSQQEYYMQAQAVLGIPIPKSENVTANRTKAAMHKGIQVLSRNKLEHMVVITIIIAGQIAVYVYSAQAVPFGLELFHDKRSGEELAELWGKVTAGMGLIGVPLVGILVDYTGLTVLPLINAACLLLVACLCRFASWGAQTLCVVCSSFFINSFMLFMVKYVVGIAPPHRLGNTQGAFSVLCLSLGVPFLVAFSVWIASFESGSGIDQYVVPLEFSGAAAFIGWLAYAFRLAQRGLPEMVMLKDDEVSMLRPFLLRNLVDAEEVLALDRKELLQRLSSDNVLVQRELFNLGPMLNNEARARYLRLARERASKLCPTVAMAAVSITLDGGWRIGDGDTEACHSALTKSFCGGQDESGEPSFDWVLDAAKPEERHELQTALVSDVVLRGVISGKRFGRTLALQSSASDDVLGVCVCFAPGGLEHFEACPKGGDRWFYVVSLLEDTLNVSSWFDFKKLNANVLERLVCIAQESIVEHHSTVPPHWYVSMLGVIPGWKGHGLARRLLSVIFNWAKEANVPCYLECGKVNVLLYEHLGFREIWSEEISCGESSTSIHGMLWPVNA